MFSCVHKENVRKLFELLPLSHNLSWWKPVVSHTSRFAYIEVVLPTRPWSIRIHRSWFAYIKKQCSHKHSNTIVIGQKNKLNLNPAICACCYYVSCIIFVWHSEALTARRLSPSLIRVSGHFATKLIRFKLFRYNSTVDLLHICSRFATRSLKT